MGEGTVIYIYTIKYYSAIKKNEIMSFAGKLIGLEGILASKVNQVQKDKSCLFSLMYGR
jgi:hypothetical protein